MGVTIKVLQKIAAALKNATYNNPKDKRLFVYRNKDCRWLGVIINLGHPMALRFLGVNAGLLLLAVLLMHILGSRVFYCVILVAGFLMVISFEGIRALWISEFGCVNDINDINNENVRWFVNCGVGYNRSYVFLIINIVIIMLPLLFTFTVYMQGLNYWIFTLCLTILALVRVVIVVYKFFRITREQTK